MIILSDLIKKRDDDAVHRFLEEGSLTMADRNLSFIYEQMDKLAGYVEYLAPYASDHDAVYRRMLGYETQAWVLDVETYVLGRYRQTEQSILDHVWYGKTAIGDDVIMMNPYMYPDMKTDIVRLKQEIDAYNLKCSHYNMQDHQVELLWLPSSLYSSHAVTLIIRRLRPVAITSMERPPEKETGWFFDNIPNDRTYTLPAELFDVRFTGQHMHIARKKTAVFNPYRSQVIRENSHHAYTFLMLVSEALSAETKIRYEDPVRVLDEPAGRFLPGRAGEVVLYQSGRPSEVYKVHARRELDPTETDKAQARFDLHDSLTGQTCPGTLSLPLSLS